MYNVITTTGIPVKMWLPELDEQTLVQAYNLAKLPFAFKHIALMPDAHCGYGMPIGGVLATRKVVIPNAVGVDIGCGMHAIKLPLKSISKSDLVKIVEKIRKAIPLGFGHHAEPQSEDLLPSMEGKNLPVVQSNMHVALHSIGTLGGGNHFIEIQKGSDDNIWVMLHSGSRGVGYAVAREYNNIARMLNEKWYSSVSLSANLAFLPLDTDEGAAYWEEMNYCLEYAKANRTLMMEKIHEILCDVLASDISIEFGLDVHHNYAAIEHHFGVNVIVHRKGATKAMENHFGIIPGSQGTSSYIVIGKGNPQSFNSCSHGAGRKLGRRQARKTLSLQEEKEKLDKLGVIHNMNNTNDLDEAPGAYKDIDEVIENQKDLIDVFVKLTPLAVVKAS